MVSAFFHKKQKKKRKSNWDLCLGLTVISSYCAIFMQFLSSGSGVTTGLGKCIVFAEATTGTRGGRGGGGGGFWSSYSAVSPSGIAIAVTAMAGIALAATVIYSRRGSLKSPWSHRRRKHALLPKQWKNLFTADGKLLDDGVKLLKTIRNGGVDPSIRAEVWPFLLEVYDFNSSKEGRDSIRTQKRKEYESLRKQCRQILKRIKKSCKLKETVGNSCNEDSQVHDSLGLEDVVSGRWSHSTEGGSPVVDDFDHPLCDRSHQTLLSTDSFLKGDVDKSVVTCEYASTGEIDSSDSDSSEEHGNTPLVASVITEENNIDEDDNDSSSPSEIEGRSKSHTDEDFATWQRIIRLDAVRANDEWMVYSPAPAAVSEIKAQRLAESVGLKDCDHLEPCRIFHAARLVAILEAYALYDPEIGYCQGMSDLLSPIISVVEDDSEAFWCFAGFMKRARHNFRLDEVGIRRQLNIVSKIIKCKDIHLYRHLENLQAEDCFFVYRMVVVLFRRELNFEQTLCLWEVTWADQAAIRAGIAKSAWGRMRIRAPPTDDLLLYAIAACVLQRRKLIIEKYSSMDEIMRECNSLAGHLDVWKLLDDAHDLVVNLHDKI
ncbi:small G protein signaling modulator 2-like isoform X2 [Durio zibethinus]|uniref:Small G protein signaling modulator 2-like isoform X2 n=1 Tax=Durio zibethinus TaxID=66656 RepID=A0A6P5XZU4_DURZI|nr:small G protein signaling modulator 2-like isoform X2 [Durio zibethinus]